MARQKVSEDKEDKVVEERPAPAGRGYFSPAPAHRGWLYGVLTVIVLILVFMFGAAAQRHHSSREFMVTGGGFKTSFIGPGRMHEQGFGFGGDTQTANGESRLNGVVTSVSGANFTVAGNGATNNVTTNSSTQYQGGNQVKQNDTVIVRGTSSNGTITATQIVINP